MRFWVLALVCPAMLCSQDQAFETRVKPILRSNCTPCHDAKTRLSGFSVESAADVIAGGSRRGVGALVDVLKGK